MSFFPNRLLTFGVVSGGGIPESTSINAKIGEGQGSSGETFGGDVADDHRGGAYFEVGARDLKDPVEESSSASPDDIDHAESGRVFVLVGTRNPENAVEESSSLNETQESG